jgi:DNA-directed RNA polymerase subunit F
MAQDVVTKEPLSLVEVKSALEKIKKRDEELNFRSNKTLEYIKTLPLATKKDFKELYDKLEALEIPRLKDIHIKKIIDLMPVNVDDLKMILSGYTITVNNDNMKKIMDVVKEYRK